MHAMRGRLGWGLAVVLGAGMLGLTGCGGGGSSDGLGSFKAWMATDRGVLYRENGQDVQNTLGLFGFPAGNRLYYGVRDSEGLTTRINSGIVWDRNPSTGTRFWLDQPGRLKFVRSEASRTLIEFVWLDAEEAQIRTTDAGDQLIGLSSVTFRADGYTLNGPLGSGRDSAGRPSGLGEAIQDGGGTSRNADPQFVTRFRDRFATIVDDWMTRTPSMRRFLQDLGTNGPSFATQALGLRGTPSSSLLEELGRAGSQTASAMFTNAEFRAEFDRARNYVVGDNP